MMSPENEDLYHILQLQPAARPKAIRAAYRRLRRRYESEGAATAAEAIDRLTRAFETLMDPRKRAEYDRQRKEAQSSRGGTGGGDGPAAQVGGAIPRTSAGGGDPAAGLFAQGPGAELLVAVIVVVLLAVTAAVFFSIVTG